MKNIKEFFDDFTFHARVMPILVLMVPLLIMGLIEGIVQNNWFENTVLSFICIVVLSITSKTARNLGKEYEKKMYTQLGGMPTTIVQRFSDNTFDEITKQRYHKKINQIEGLCLPENKMMETPLDDQQYISAANILRNYANSNRDKEFRVYQELKDYNFWRNLYGTKKIALLVYFAILVREVITKDIESVKEVILNPYPEYISFIVMAISILFIMLFVNHKTVSQKGFDYAKALIEVCERIPVNEYK